MTYVIYILPAYEKFNDQYNPILQAETITQPDIKYNGDFRPAGFWRLNFGQGDHPNALNDRHVPFEFTDYQE